MPTHNAPGDHAVQARFHLSLLSLAVLTLLSAQPVWAQEAAPAAADNGANTSADTAQTQAGEATSGRLGNVVVTANRRKQNIQKTAISIKAVGSEEISNQALSNASDVLKNVANVEVQGASRGSVIAIRGLGSNLPPGVGESAVSTNYDGVYNTRAEQANVGFFDLDRVEVLRGPQGTLYGRNATGGVVNVISKNPVLGKLEGNASLELGSYNLVRTEGAANLPISDTVALRASTASVSRDGYLNNGHMDNKASAGRIKLLVKPNSDVSVLAGIEVNKLGGKGQGATEVANWPDNKLTTADSDVGFQDYHSEKVWVQADVNLGFGTLTVLPSHHHGSGRYYGYFGGNGSNGSDPRDITQNSLEVRLAAPDDAKVKWVGGLYHYDMYQAQDGVGLSAGGIYSSDEHWANSNAAFGQVTVPLDDSLRLTGGLRYTSDHKAAQVSGYNTYSKDDVNKTWSKADWKIGLEFDLSKQVLGYATVSTGNRPGGFNNVNGSPYEPETLTSYEAGIKSRLLDNRLQLNLAGFYYDYQNYQTVDFYLNDATGDFTFAFQNIAKQKIYGLELESEAMLSENDRLTASLSLLHATIGEGFTAHLNGPTSAGTDMSGKPLPQSPKATLKVGYQHAFHLDNGATVTARTDLRHVSGQYVSLTETEASWQKAYTVADASLVYRSPDDKWGLSGYVKNLTNEVVKTGYFVGYITPSMPRTVGMVVNARF
jgi:iron complex outermembrane receptor protein